MAARILFYWTLFGSFLVLTTLGYLYYQYATLNYIYLRQVKFSQSEILFLFTNIIVGFAIKIPVAPLHYWLLKVHVESPTAFSIYLSGFLVKSALFCLYMFLSVLNETDLYFGLTLWILYSLMVSTLGLSRQVDIKKLIAWATIQEMSFMLLFLVLKQLFLIHSCIIFVLLHGLMSSYMFYTVDILQRRFKTRSLQKLSGLNLIFPEITKYIWFLILLFSGFPLTVKFFVEWSIISLLLDSNRVILIVVLFFLNYLSVIFFCKILFGVLYGVPTLKLKSIELCEIQKKEKIILNSLVYFIVMLILIVFAIKW
jgi:NADH-quinone oxidoreductase subunit M